MTVLDIDPGCVRPRSFHAYVLLAASRHAESLRAPQAPAAPDPGSPAPGGAPAPGAQPTESRDRRRADCRSDPADARCVPSPRETLEVNAPCESRAAIAARVAHRMGELGLSETTRGNYIGWIQRFLASHQQLEERQLRAAHIEQFLRELFARPDLGECARDDALSALLFLYREALDLRVRWTSKP